MFKDIFPDKLNRLVYRGKGPSQKPLGEWVKGKPGIWRVYTGSQEDYESAKATLKHQRYEERTRKENEAHKKAEIAAAGPKELRNEAYKLNKGINAILDEIEDHFNKGGLLDQPKKWADRLRKGELKRLKVRPGTRLAKKLELQNPEVSKVVQDLSMLKERLFSLNRTGKSGKDVLSRIALDAIRTKIEGTVVIYNAIKQGDPFREGLQVSMKEVPKAKGEVLEKLTPAQARMQLANLMDLYITNPASGQEIVAIGIAKLLKNNPQALKSGKKIEMGGYNVYIQRSGKDFMLSFGGDKVRRYKPAKDHMHIYTGRTRKYPLGEIRVAKLVSPPPIGTKIFIPKEV